MAHYGDSAWHGPKVLSKSRMPAAALEHETPWHETFNQEHSQLEQKHSDLEAEQGTLDQEHKQLEQKHSNLDDGHETLNQEHKQLKAGHREATRALCSQCTVTTHGCCGRTRAHGHPCIERLVTHEEANRKLNGDYMGSVLAFFPALECLTQPHH